MTTQTLRTKCLCVLEGMDYVQNVIGKWTDNVLLTEPSIDDISMLSQCN